MSQCFSESCSSMIFCSCYSRCSPSPLVPENQFLSNDFFMCCVFEFPPPNQLYPWKVLEERQNYYSIAPLNQQRKDCWFAYLQYASMVQILQAATEQKRSNAYYQVSTKHPYKLWISTTPTPSPQIKNC